MKLPKMPPKPDRNPLSMAGKVIKDAAASVDDLARDLDQTLSSLAPAETEVEEEPQPATEEAINAISGQATLAWQLDHLIDDLLHLEVDHLPQQGRINGKPCDCIAKGGREARRHAMETIPIAARQGAPAKIFTEIAQWANHLIDIGNLSSVQSGKYDDEYLSQSGTASNFRKLLEAELSELKKSHREECETCQSLTSLKDFIQKRQKGKPA